MPPVGYDTYHIIMLCTRVEQYCNCTQLLTTKTVAFGNTVKTEPCENHCNLNNHVIFLHNCMEPPLYTK